METSIEERLNKTGENAFYTLAGVCQWLGLPEEVIFERIFSKEMVAVSTIDGSLMFPVSQFSQEPEITKN